MPVTHAFQSAKQDGPDSTLVQPSNWNAGHSVDLTVTSTSSDLPLTSAHEYVRATAGAGGVSITLPTAVGITGRLYHIKRVDAGAGNVTIATTSGQTIDGASSKTLTKQWQWVSPISDGSNWQILSRG